MENNMMELLYESNILNQNINYYILENKYNEIIGINEVNVDTRWQKIKNGIIKVLNKLFGRFKFIFDKIGKILGILPKAIKFMMNALNHISKAKYRDNKKEIVCCDIGNLTKSLDKCYLISNKDINDAYRIVNERKIADGDFQDHIATFEKGIIAIKEIKDDFNFMKKEINEKKKVIKTYPNYNSLEDDYINFTKELNGDSYENYRQGTAHLKSCIDDTRAILKDLNSIKPYASNAGAEFLKKAIQYYSELLSMNTLYLSLINSTEIFIMKQFKKFISRNNMKDLEYWNSDYLDDFNGYISRSGGFVPEDED